MNGQLFSIQPFSTIDKRVEITGPDGLRFFVDYDDVDHKTVRKQMAKLIGILNDHWDSTEE